MKTEAIIRIKYNESMKKKLTVILIIFLLAGAGIAAWIWFRGESEEAKIARSLDELCRICSKSKGDNTAVLALRANQGTEKLFARVCLLNFRVGRVDGKTNPTRLAAGIVRIQHLFERLKFSVSDLKVTIEKPDKAAAVFSGSVKGQGKNSRSVDEVRDIEAKLKRDEKGSWKIVSMTFHEVLER